MHIIAGKFHRRKILAPKGLETRPTASRLREAVFNILQDSVNDAEFLDIFAGSGAMGIEALSRGAKQATFIEKDRAALVCLEKNLAQLQAEDQGIILAGDFLIALKKLQRLGKKFDIIFADAPYQLTRGNTPVSKILLDCIGSHTLLKKEGYLFIENDHPEPPQNADKSLTWINSRRSGKAYLHYFRRVK